MANFIIPLTSQAIMRFTPTSSIIPLMWGLACCFFAPSTWAQYSTGRPPETAAEFDALLINQIQVIGSHNSFKAAIDAGLYDKMISTLPSLQELDYAHPPLADQLNLGLRNLELDLLHDPSGGLYARPLGLTMVSETDRADRPYDPQGKMREPGFKVLHVQDIDYRSHCLTLDDALQQLRRWSNRHPRHLPVIVTFNLKEAPIRLPGAAKPLPFDRAALDALDHQLRTTLGEQKLILPDDVRGNYNTLEAAVLDGAWPTIAAARGRFLLVLDETGRKRDDYLAGHAGLRGRVLFVESEPGHPEAAVMILNDPRRQGETITQRVRQGYLVRTRADAGTREARDGDFTRFEAAKRSGAQVISTDYYLADWRLNPSFRIRFDQGDCYRLNPVTGPPPGNVFP